MAKAYVEERTQKATGQWPRQGPELYVAVQVVPDGVVKLKALNNSVAEKRGIKIIYCGEGYGRNYGPRSAIYAARRKAEQIADRINNGAVEWDGQVAYLPQGPK